MTDLERAQHMVAEWFELALKRVEEIPVDEFRLLCDQMLNEVSEDVQKRRLRRVTGRETMPWQP